ncbi:hypothetical protein BDP27DRAFT_1439408 [Rhodocollybia butyracea]|uniref:Uncharacterized protein n=1 Tax=Rhodocollybia butyracea TaxID=206335 RepID=A0A9P5P0Y4_9AGAR|nr:hypothetical protein BDP27DRAFT_1439408 [Rhodocollybia butyracea]
MTPEEVAETSAAGFVLFYDLATIILNSTLFGIYCLGFYISFQIYMRKRMSGSATKAMICVLFGTFVLMLMLFVSHIGFLLGLVKIGLVVSLPGGIMEQSRAADVQPEAILYQNISSWLSNSIILIADAVIVWRACAVWTDSKKVKWTLLMFMLAELESPLAPGVSLADGVNVSLDFPQEAEVKSIVLDSVTFVLSLNVNVVATCSIAFRAWTHHRSMRSTSSSLRRKRTKVEEVLILLVESGAIYALSQLLTIILSVLDEVKTVPQLQLVIAFVTSVITPTCIMCVALNPVAIFILVQTKNTYEQSFYLEEIPLPLVPATRSTLADFSHFE